MEKVDAMRSHSLITDNLDEIPALYGTEHIPIEEKTIHIKLFHGNSTWLITELDQKTGEAFGYCDLGMGYPEWGMSI